MDKKEVSGIETRKFLAAAKELLKNKKSVTGSEIRKFLNDLEVYYAELERKLNQ